MRKHCITRGRGFLHRRGGQCDDYDTHPKRRLPRTYLRLLLEADGYGVCDAVSPPPLGPASLQARQVASARAIQVCSPHEGVRLRTFA
jgi:hypothetical protein